MAEYYPLLSRAVAGLREAQPEARQAIYNRARQALLAQLRSMQPPVPETDIERESAALEDAISRVEADAAASATSAAPSPGVAVEGAPVAAPPVAAPSTAPARPGAANADSRAVGGAPASRAAAPKPAAATAQGSARGNPPDVTTPAPPIVASQPPPVEPRVPTRPPGGRTPGPASQPAPVTAVAGSPGGLRPAPEAPAPLRVSRAGEEPGKPALPVAPRLQVRPAKPPGEQPPQSAPEGPMPTPTSAEEPSFETEMRRQGSVREEAVRPAAPRRVDRKTFSPRLLIVALVAAVVVAGIAYAAWRLRDKPEALARSRAALLAAQKAEPQPGKIVERADGGAPSAPAPAPVEKPTPPTAPAGAPAVVPGSPPAAAPPPVVEAQQPTPGDKPAAPAIPAPTSAEPSSTAPAGIAPQPAPDQSIPVSQRAALLVDAPDEPEKVKTYVGTVVWRNENVSPGQDQPLANAVRADVEIPAAGLTVSVLFQKNFEAQFPASHTVEIRFTPGPDNKLGNIKQINVPQLRKDDLPTGDGLVGLPVTITDNYFLVGLTRGDAEARNLDLIKTRNWIDVPLLFVSGKIGKVTFEKGASGERLVNDTIQGWQ